MHAEACKCTQLHKHILKDYDLPKLPKIYVWAGGVA